MSTHQKYAASAARFTVKHGGEPVKIDGKNYTGTVEEMSFDEVVAMGGNAESGGFRATIPVEQFKKPPESGQSAKAGDSEDLVILSFNVHNGTTYEILAGDPVAQD